MTVYANDELEVSIFGPGIGECVVAHLGDGDWLIVDSCVDPDTRNPVALDYLKEIGVDAGNAVKLVVVTHWHDDHMNGAAQVLEECKSAEFACSAALNISEFKSLLKVSRSPFLQESGIDEFRNIVSIQRERRKKNQPGFSAGPNKWVIADRVLYDGPKTKITGLSPSDASKTLAVNEIAGLLPKVGEPKRRLVAQRPNALCVVLWMSMGSTNVLLGSDLEVTENPTTGWTAILESCTRPKGNAGVFKVPHHGSSGADDPRVWSQLLTAQPVALITPFRRSNLPLDTDCRRILCHTPHAYLSAPSRLRRKKPSDSAVRKTIKMVAPDMRPIESKMGYVRLRWKDVADPSNVETFGVAKGLQKRVL